MATLADGSVNMNVLHSDLVLASGCQNKCQDYRWRHTDVLDWYLFFGKDVRERRGGRWRCEYDRASLWCRLRHRHERANVCLIGGIETLTANHLAMCLVLWH